MTSPTLPLTRILAIAFLAFSTARAPAARAQLVGLNHVWTVPVVLETGANISTVIGCHNSTNVSVLVGVEIYGPDGGYVTGNSTVAAPSETVLIATGAVANLPLDVNLNTGVTKGHARILATTSKGVLCSAFLADTATGMPAANLTVVKKLAQKGD